MNPAIKMRFDGYMDIENIRKRVTLHPDPAEGLEALQPWVAAEKDALTENFIGVMKQALD